MRVHWTHLRCEGSQGSEGSEGGGIALTGDEYKVSVTGLAFSVIRYDRNSADWLATLAAPFPAAPDFPLCRGQNKTPRNTLFISISTVSTGCCAPSKRGKGGGASHQRGNAFPRPQGGCMVFTAKGGIKNGAESAVPRQRSDTIYLPRARALNLSGRRQPVPDRTLGAQGQRPGGAINPHARKGVSTFGNTGKHRPGPGPEKRL